MPERGLRCATGRRIFGRGVEPILENVEVEGAEFFRAEDLQRLHHAVELEGSAVGFGLLGHLAGEGQRVAVDVQPLLDRHAVLLDIEVGGVGEQEAQGVAHAAIDLDDAIENFLGDGQLARVVGAGDPQTQNFGAEFVGDFLRHDDVADRLAHLVALAVHRKAVGQQRVVGRVAVDGAAGEQRGVKPAAVLVRAFEVEVGTRAGGVAIGVRAAQHMPVRGAGVEPHVERVADLGVLGRLVAEQLGGVELEPGFDAFLLDALGNLIHQLDGARMQLAGLFMQEERNRHAPVALA